MNLFSIIAIAFWFVGLCNANELAPFVHNARRGEGHPSVEQSINSWKNGGPPSQGAPSHYGSDPVPPVTTDCEESETPVCEMIIRRTSPLTTLELIFCTVL
jgi:hypothetical protein